MVRKKQIKEAPAAPKSKAKRKPRPAEIPKRGKPSRGLDRKVQKLPAKPSELERLQVQFVQLQSEYHSLRVMHGQVLQQHAQLQRVDEQLQSRATQAESRAGELERRVAELATERDGLRAEVPLLQAELHRLEEIKRELAEANARIEAQRRDQESLGARLQDQNRGLASINEQLQARIKSLTENNTNLQARGHQLQKAVNRLEEERVELDRAHKELLEIKGMYYYRWACRLDRFRVALGLRSDPKKPRRQIEDRRVSGLIEDRSAPTPQPEPMPPTNEPVQAVPAVHAVRAAAPASTTEQLTIGVIMDKFTMACFEPECNLVTFRPDNWEATLREQPVDFLFVESAWAGNGGSWQYRVGTYAAPPGHELDHLLAWCRKKGIPTVFWNKEDPSHFEKFAAAASKFDRVFTTDANCIERYKKHCGQSNVEALPFAAQPRIHNPVLTRARDGRTCFAGTYYADTFEARRRDMETLLRGGASFGLDIYDRLHGYAGADAARFVFPEEFRPLIRGRLEYERMLEAYRQYRVFLNVNSIHDSPTMFSRRVFELLACGTPVVTTPSLGVGLMFGDVVPQARTAEEVRSALARLFADDAHWWRTSARGIRLVMERHTYAHRLKTVCERIGLDVDDPAPAGLAVVVTPQGNPLEFAERLRRQTERPEAVIVAGEDNLAGAFGSHLSAAGFNTSLCAVANLERTVREKIGEGSVAFMSGLNAYGPHYLRDARLALDYCGKDVTGMATHYALAGGALNLRHEAGEEYFMRERLLGETLVLRARMLNGDLAARASTGGLVRLEEPGFARGRFEFVAACPGPLNGELARKVFLTLPD